MFRALRELLLSGNIKGLLDGSRRQARLLAQFSPEFGQRSGWTPPDEFVMNATRARGAPANLTPDDVWNSEAFNLGVSFGAQSPFGGTVNIYDDGRRYRPAPNMYSPIVAPYEGGRAWPMFKDPYSGSSYPGAFREPQWMGRGPAPTPEFYNGYDDGFVGGPSMYPADPGVNTFDVPRAFWDRPYGYNFPSSNGRVRGWDY